ncbi:MAG: hypothetical protein Q4C56_07430 [Peptococcaceae bacterium]|nr:hypothetical protein [Peptococcaceae bacterium]
MKRGGRRWLCAILLALVVLAGCGENYASSEYTGSWRAATGEMGGASVALDDLSVKFSYRLEADGSVQMQLGRTEKSGRWTPGKNGITLSLEDEDQTYTFKESDDGDLVGDIDGLTLTFEKSK